MPLPRIVATDHLVLAGLSLKGDFVTLAEPLIVKRWGGASVSHRANARALRVQNRWLILFPYLVREWYLQRLIYRADALTASGKLSLSVWSWWNYFWQMLRLSAFTIYANLPAPLRRLVKRAIGR